MRNDDPFRPIEPKSFATLRSEYQRDRILRILLSPIDLAASVLLWPFTRETKTQRVLRAAGENFRETLSAVMGENIREHEFVESEKFIATGVREQ